MPPALAAQTAARGALAAPVRWRRCAPHAPCWPARRSSAFPQPVPCSPPCTQPPSAAAAAGEGGPATDATSSTHGDVPPSAAAAAVPPPSRLQQEVALLVAMDVEYTHLALQPGGRQVSLPAEVCALDAEGRVLLYEHCNPTGEPQPQRRCQALVRLPPPTPACVCCGSCVAACSSSPALGLTEPHPSPTLHPRSQRSCRGSAGSMQAELTPRCGATRRRWPTCAAAWRRC